MGAGESCQRRFSCWGEFRSNIAKLESNLVASTPKELEDTFTIPLSAGGFGVVKTDKDGFVIAKFSRSAQGEKNEIKAQRELRTQAFALDAVLEWQKKRNQCETRNINAYVPIPLMRMGAHMAMERVRPIKGVPRTLDLMVHASLSTMYNESRAALVNKDLPFSPENTRGYYLAPHDLTRFLEEARAAGYARACPLEVSEVMGGIYGCMILNRNMFPKDIEIVFGEDRCPGEKQKLALWAMDFGMAETDSIATPYERMEQVTFDMYIPSERQYLAYFLLGFVESAINEISGDDLIQYAKAIVSWINVSGDENKLTDLLAMAMRTKEISKILDVVNSIE